MKTVYGNMTGLKASQTRRLEKFYRRRIPPENIFTADLARDVGALAFEIQRQIGMLIDRSGKITHVIVGDHQKIVIPGLSDYRAAPGRLNGLRCVHFHLAGERLTHDDLTDLALLRLDLMGVITLSEDGRPEKMYAAHIRPGAPGDGTIRKEVDSAYQHLDPIPIHGMNIGFPDLVRALENEIASTGAMIEGDFASERALLVSVTTAPRHHAEASLDELRELALSSGIQVLGTVLQRRKKIDARFLMGRGKLGELTIMALQKGISVIIFDQEMNPSQIRSITDQVDLKVIDRTQLILDIFAQRAQSREGKLQVELAQLKYLLPRLVTKNTAMSRLTGGIGGRGPGETKLEINRRRVRERIRRLESALDTVKKQRKQQKAQRSKRQLPVISIIGYTNAGKSTLLNTLTHSAVLAESRLFATLDPSSRRLRFPRDLEVIITDTVGFIRNLPKELMVAFRATLEELESADLLLHVIDISNPRYADHIKSVNRILEDLDLRSIPLIHVLNKLDQVEKSFAEDIAARYDGVAVSAVDRSTLMPLIERMEHCLG